MPIPYTFNPLGASFGLGYTPPPGSLVWYDENEKAMVLFDANSSDGSDAFYGKPIGSYNFNLPNLTNGSYMFAYCTSLTAFGAGPLEPKPDLTITNGSYMFMGCTSLVLVDAYFPYLENGDGMFSGAKLNGGSALAVLQKLPTYSTGTHTLCLGTATSFQDNTGLATTLGTTVPIAAGTYSYRGWSVVVEEAAS